MRAKGPPINFDRWQVDIACPKCGAKNKISLGQIEREETVPCVGCRVNIKLQDDKEGVTKLRHSLDKIQRMLKKLES